MLSKPSNKTPTSISRKKNEFGLKSLFLYLCSYNQKSNLWKLKNTSKALIERIIVIFDFQNTIENLSVSWRSQISQKNDIRTLRQLSHLRSEHVSKMLQNLIMKGHLQSYLLTNFHFSLFLHETTSEHKNFWKKWDLFQNFPQIHQFFSKNWFWETFF